MHTHTHTTVKLVPSCTLVLACIISQVPKDAKAKTAALLDAVTICLGSDR